MSSIGERAVNEQGEIDLIDLWRVLWNRKILIAIIVVVGAAGAAVIALVSTEIFRAEVIMTEVSQDNMGGVNSMVDRLGGLAGLVGMNLGNKTGAAVESRAILESRRLIEEFIQRYNLQAELLRNSDKPATGWFAVQAFRAGVLTIRDDETDGTTTVAIDWKNADTAARWANDFVALANEVIRARAMNNSKKNIDYLTQQIKKTDVVEVQRVMYSLIESETKTLMLANGRAEYAFSVVDPAVPPQIRVRPRRTVMVLLGGVLGLFVGVLAAFTLNAVARSKADRARSVQS